MSNEELRHGGRSEPDLDLPEHFVEIAGSMLQSVLQTISDSRAKARTMSDVQKRPSLEMKVMFDRWSTRVTENRKDLLYALVGKMIDKC